MGVVTEKEYEVHYYETNYRLECKISSIINYFCDIGTNQSELLGVGIDYLTEKGLAWVFYKYDIKVNRYPKYGEKIKVVTRAKSFKKFYASREYSIYDKNNEKIVEGEGIFLLIDIDRRRALRIPEEQYTAYGVDIDTCSDIKLTKIEKLKEKSNKSTFKVRYGDIDSNMHVNNVRYVEWAIESIPLDIVLNYQLKELTVIFQKECRYGTEISALYEIRDSKDSLIILHSIEDSDGKELSALISKWQKVNGDDKAYNIE